MSAHIATPPSSADTAAGARLWLVKNGVFLLALAVVLFGSAGRLDWPNGWVYLAIIVLLLSANALLLSPELRAERSKIRRGTKRWDMVLASVMAIWGPMLVYLIAGLDRRFGWTNDLSLSIVLAGIVFGVAGHAFSFGAMLVNSFFSITVRIQAERGHHVIDTGPYRLVRHPGYLGSVVHYLAAPLILGSVVAYIPALLLLALIFVRTALEDRTLQAELPGYRDYAARVRYRLLPGIW